MLFCSKTAYPTDAGIPLALYHATNISAPINQLSFSGVCLSMCVLINALMKCYLVCRQYTVIINLLQEMVRT